MTFLALSFPAVVDFEAEETWTLRDPLAPGGFYRESFSDSDSEVGGTMVIGFTFFPTDYLAIELARNQYLKAAWLKDQGRRHAFEASAAKLYASEMVEKVASDAVQIHGGYGYMEEYPVSRYYKSVKLLQIVEGTSEVQRMLIARTLAGTSHR